MTKKEFVKGVLPPFVYMLGKAAAMSFKMYGSRSTIAALRETRPDRMFILGNGPSLLQDAAATAELMRGAGVMAVNLFARHELFERLKPGFYVLADPFFFGDIDSYSESGRKLIGGALDALVEKTQWEMNLIVPDTALGTPGIKRLESNKLLRISYYNNTVHMPYLTQAGKFKRYDANSIPPPAQTVLNVCLYLALYWGCGETYLLGANSSWHEDMMLDQNDNRLYMRDRHFYGEARRPFYRVPEKEIFFKVHEAMQSATNMFAGYWELQEYADHRQVKVYNATHNSWIDAFPRRYAESKTEA